MCNQYYCYFDLPKIRVGRARTTNKKQVAFAFKTFNLRKLVILETENLFGSLNKSKYIVKFNEVFLMTYKNL